MTRLKFYQNADAMKVGYHPLEVMLVVLFFLGVSSAVAVGKTIAYLAIAHLTSVDLLSSICVRGIIALVLCLAFFANIAIFQSEYEECKFFTRIPKAFLKYKNDRECLIASKNYKYSILSLSSDGTGFEYLCHDFASRPDGTVTFSQDKDATVWEERDNFVHYTQIRDLSDGHTLALTEIKNHALPSQKTKCRRASKSKGRN